MLGQSTTTTTTYADSKLYTASLLSSLANNGELVTPTSYPSVPNFLTSMTGTGTTPTLTPTSLASLEQTFIELQSAPSEGAGPHPGCEPHTQSGFVPPVVDMSSREQSQDSYDSSDGEWEPAPKRGRGSYVGADGSLVMAGGDAGQSGSPQRKYTRRSRNEKLTPEEEEKRRVRRERNKLAAAKCRQRRVDHTNTLLEETEQLETEKSNLENEIQTLQHERDQLQFLLQSHEPVCKVDVRHTSAAAAAAAAAAFKIKSEPADFVLGNAGGGCASSSPRMAYTSPSTLVSSSSSGMMVRPSSLALKSSDPHHQQLLPLVVSCSTGVPLSTPSSGLYTYTSLDSLVEGSTGLTPLTAGPGPVVSCASQVQRNEGEIGADGVSSPTLVSL